MIIFAGFLFAIVACSTACLGLSFLSFVYRMCTFAVRGLEFVVFVLRHVMGFTILLASALFEASDVVVNAYRAIQPQVSQVVAQVVDSVVNVYGVLHPLLFPVLRQVGEMLHIVIAACIHVFNLVVHEAPHSLLALWATVLGVFHSLNIFQRPVSANNNANTHRRRLYPDLPDSDFDNSNVEPEQDRDHSGVRRRRGVYPDLPEHGNTVNQQDSGRVVPSAPFLDEETEQNWYNRDHRADSSESLHYDSGFSDNVGNNNSNSAGNIIDNDDENRLCVVCFDKERSTAVFPCGHTHMCLQCTRTVIKDLTLCPICMTSIKEYRVVYL